MANPIKFEVLKTVGTTNICSFARTMVRGDWLIVIKGCASGTSDHGNAITFMPDPTHSWNGESL